MSKKLVEMKLCTSGKKFNFGILYSLETDKKKLFTKEEEFYSELFSELKKHPHFEIAVKRHTTNYLHEAGYKLLTPDNEVINW